MVQTLWLRGEIDMKKFFATLLAIIISAVMMTGCSLLRKEAASPKAMTLQLENSALTVAVPFPMTDGNMEGHFGDAAPYVRQSLMKSSENREMVVLIFGFVYDKKKIEREYKTIFEPDLEGGLYGAVGNLQNVQHTNDVKDVNIKGLRGKEITGTLKIKFPGDSSLSLANFRMMAFAKGADFWMVGVIRKPDNDTLAISTEIFKSIKLR